MTPGRALGRVKGPLLWTEAMDRVYERISGAGLLTMTPGMVMDRVSNQDRVLNNRQGPGQSRTVGSEKGQARRRPLYSRYLTDLPVSECGENV